MKSAGISRSASTRAARHLASALVTALALGSTAVAAQSWPTKIVTVMVPTVAGSAPDSYARVLVEVMSKITGGTFIVENKPVAAGNQAAESTVRAAADGHTLLLGTQALMTINPTTYPQAKWQPKDFVGIVKGVEAPLVLVTHPSVPAKSFAELRPWLEKERGKIAYASFSGGTPSHFLGHQLSEKLKAEMFHVPYKGSAPQINDLLGGQVPIGFTQLATSAPHIQGGKLTPLAQTGAKRSRLLRTGARRSPSSAMPDLTSARSGSACWYRPRRRSRCRTRSGRLRSRPTGSRLAQQAREAGLRHGGLPSRVRRSTRKSKRRLHAGRTSSRRPDSRPVD